MRTPTIPDPWFDDYAEEDDLQIDEYEITATPNDFNVSTLFNFIEAGAVRIPGFQRNFVWDQVRASKLIESLALGIPVPQLFLYEQTRNQFLVIDGQQRLISIYYFIKQKFPRKEKRVELSTIFDLEGKIPDAILHDDAYFQDFKLKLSERLPNQKNKFHGLNYSTPGDYKTQFELRPIRNVIVKQSSPPDDDSSMFDVFNHLNASGINLRPQEIRTSMYHSNFYDMLYKVNTDEQWRRLLNSEEPDLHMKDIEILLRGFAMLINGQSYAPSMVRFLNQFSRLCEQHDDTQNEYLQDLFLSFLDACCSLPEDAFINPNNNRFNISLFEASFTATCDEAFKERRLLEGEIDSDEIAALETGRQFVTASLEGTTRTTNVSIQLKRVKALVNAL